MSLQLFLRGNGFTFASVTQTGRGATVLVPQRNEERARGPFFAFPASRVRVRPVLVLTTERRTRSGAFLGFPGSRVRVRFDFLLGPHPRYIKPYRQLDEYYFH